MLRALVIAVAAIAVVWVAFMAVVFVVRPPDLALSDAMRLLPDTLRLVRRLAADRSIPLGARVSVWLLLVYLASPIDLIPDFVPVIGYADDAILVSFVLRRLVRRAGSEKLREQWPGSPEGLETLRRVLRLSE
ncbi:MAG: hypothetical protein QOC79_318 [Actinomycetota bacterium]|nr:hypothetical protein [Actinomycetota bacterium]